MNNFVLPRLQFAISLLCFRTVINLSMSLPGNQTQTEHLQGDLGDFVLIVYLKPDAENNRNLTNRTTCINSKLPLLFRVHIAQNWSVDSQKNH